MRNKLHGPCGTAIIFTSAAILWLGCAVHADDTTQRDPEIVKIEEIASETSEGNAEEVHVRREARARAEAREERDHIRVERGERDSWGRLSERLGRGEARWTARSERLGGGLGWGGELSGELGDALEEEIGDLLRARIQWGVDLQRIEKEMEEVERDRMRLIEEIHEMERVRMTSPNFDGPAAEELELMERAKKERREKLLEKSADVRAQLETADLRLRRRKTALERLDERVLFGDMNQREDLEDYLMATEAWTNSLQLVGNLSELANDDARLRIFALQQLEEAIPNPRDRAAALRKIIQQTAGESKQDAVHRAAWLMLAQVSMMTGDRDLAEEIYMCVILDTPLPYKSIMKESE